MNKRTRNGSMTNRIIGLDFDGGLHIYRNTAIMGEGKLPALVAPSGIASERRNRLAAKLNHDCAGSGIRFTVGRNDAADSTIHIGKSNAFDTFGHFLGLAEGIGSGNAFVLLNDSASDDELLAVIHHETGHILGTLDHGGAGLARYAWVHKSEGWANLALIYGEDHIWEDRLGAKYIYSLTTTKYKYTEEPVPDYITNITLHPKDNGTVYEYVYAYEYYHFYWQDGELASRWDRANTTYNESELELSFYAHASGTQAETITIEGGIATGCTAKRINISGGETGHNEEPVPVEYGSWVRNYDYHYEQGVAEGCKANYITVTGRAVARNCEAREITVSGASEYLGYTSHGGSYTKEYRYVNGLVENCRTSSLYVNPGGIATDIQCGYARVGIKTTTAEEVEKANERIAQNGTAKLSNFYDNGKGGSVWAYRGAEVQNVYTTGSINASEGAILKGSLTCGNVNLSGVVPQSTITIKVDLHDYARANYTERIYDDNGREVKTIEYYANYTTKTYTYSYNVNGSYTTTVTHGTFDNADGRFDMRNWVYTFNAHIGNVDALSLPYITVDFGGTESDFGGGTLGFYYPSTTREIQFVMNSNKQKWREVWDDGRGNDLGEYQNYIVYDPTLHGEAAEVLWLENGDEEEVEYTVALPSGLMGGATEDVVIDGDVGGEAELKNSQLIVKGSVETGDVTVKAEDKNNVQHECDLELIVVPEEMPLFGKAGAKVYSESLRSAQKTHTSSVSTTLKNIHINSMFGAKFDASDLGMKFTVDWTHRSAELKFQGKFEWTPSGAMAGSGKQVKVVIDLSGDNYISVTHNFNNKTFSWALVGELKVPDFNIGKFRFSNMALKVDTVSSSFYASAYIQLPGVKYSFGGDIGIVDGCIDSMHIGMDNLNVRLGTTGLRLQSFNGGFSGMATQLEINIEAGIGLSFGSKKHYTNLAWLDIGLDDGEFYPAELNLDAQISTDGKYTGTATISAGAGFITGGGEFHFEDDYFSLNGDFSMMGKVISGTGTLIASKGNFTISGSGAMNLPNEKTWGPLAGTGMSVNTFVDFGKEYLMAWSVINVFGNQFSVGIKCTFAGDVDMLGSSELLGGDKFGTRGLRTLNVSNTDSNLRGGTQPSASETYTIADYGLSLFQFNFTVSGSWMSLAHDGVEYTQADIAAGVYGNMQLVGDLTSATCITIAVSNAALGDWTINAYGDEDATFGAYTLVGNAPPSVIDSVELGADGRSAVIHYTLPDLSALDYVTISIFRNDTDATDYNGLLLAEFAPADATGTFEYALDDAESKGGDYAFYMMVTSANYAPVYSGISEAITFLGIDTEAPNQIQSIDAVYLSTGSTLAWYAPYDDFGVTGYKVSYRSSDEAEWTEANVAAASFTFAAVPNGTYTYRVAAYDEAGNIAAWSVEDAVLVNLAANATYKNTALTEDTALAEYEGAVNVDATAAKLIAAKNSLVSASTLGDAEISGIVEDSIIVGETELFIGALGRDLTVNGSLLVGGNSVDEEVINPFVDGIPESIIDTTNLATAENVTVAAGGALTVGNYGRVNGVTVASGGALYLVGDAEFSDVFIDYGATLTIGGNGRYDLTDNIRIAGKLNAGRNVYGNGSKIVFEQYKQTTEFQDSLDDVAFVSNMDKLVGDVLEIEIDSEAYGRYKIADEAKYFNGTITVVSHNDGSSAAVGLGEFTLVGNALCRLVYYNEKYGAYGLYLDVARSQIGAPVVSVENAENDYEDTISVSATPADDTGNVAQYTFRYSLNADMSDAVVVTPEGNKNNFTIAKDALTADATYYMQVSVENSNGVQSLWSEAQSFTVIPKLNRPAAPTISVRYDNSPYWNYIYISVTPAWNTSPRQYSFRYSLNADMSDAVVVTPQEWYGYIDIDKADLVANATYYLQARVESTEGILGDWGNTDTFTVVPVSDVPPAAPTNLTVTETDGGTVGYFRAEVDRDDANSDIRGYRFRYADNPEMENAVTVSTSNANYNYANFDRGKLEDGRDYYFQGAVKLGTEWSAWTDAVTVSNILGWNYENITIGPEGDYNYFSLGGKRAKNVTVVDGGYFYGGGRIDGLTIETGGFFRDDNATITNAVVNGGRYWLDSGTVTDLVVNGGELRLMDGTLNGAVIGVDAEASLSDNKPVLHGTILIQGAMDIYYNNPPFATDASFVFDLGAHEATKDKMFINYTSPLVGTRTFTVQLDNTPETGDYRLTYTPNSGELYVSLAAADGGNLGVMGIGLDPILYKGLYYSLVDQKGVTYLHVSDNDGPAFIGKVKLSKNGTVYDSSDGYTDIAVSSAAECDRVLVDAGGQLFAVTVGDGGKAVVHGDVFGATVENGGCLTLKADSRALANPVTVKKGGNVTIEGGQADLGAAFHLAGGTITVKGRLQSFEDEGEWGPTRHWFVFDLDQMAAAPTDVMISNYKLLLDCTPTFTVNVATKQAEGLYKLMGNAASFTGAIAIHYEGDNDWPPYLGVGQETKINGQRYALTIQHNVLTLTVGKDVPYDGEPEEPSIVQTQTWEANGNGGYVVEYSVDSFQTAVRVSVTDNALDAFAVPSDDYQWRVRPQDGDKWTTGEALSAKGGDDEIPQHIVSNDDGVADVFFTKSRGTWNGGFEARHNGNINGWQGTDEAVPLAGKNKLADIIEGSEDANVLLMTDAANGDALFVDDIYSALPGDIDEQQARIAKINEIRAGAGDDIVDLTSQQFAYIGGGVTFRGGMGDDVIWANKGNNWLFGDSGDDRLIGASGNDVIIGGFGNDSLHGGGGDDIFAFGGDWGNDSVEQLADGKVTLWFKDGDENKWDASTLTYNDGDNSVKVTGVALKDVSLQFGDDGSGKYADLLSAGAFEEFTSEKIFEDRNKGMLA